MPKIGRPSCLLKKKIAYLLAKNRSVLLKKKLLITKKCIIINALVETLLAPPLAPVIRHSFGVRTGARIPYLRCQKSGTNWQRCAWNSGTGARILAPMETTLKWVHLFFFIGNFFFQNRTESFLFFKVKIGPKVS